MKGTKSNPHNISTPELNRLKRLALSVKVELDDLLNEYETASQTLTEQGVKENLDRLAVNYVMNVYRKKTIKPFRSNSKSEVVTVVGFLVGSPGIWDKVETVRKQVRKFINEHGVQAAIEAQKIDGDNNILDQRMKLFGRENPGYLKPLPPTLHQRDLTLYGFFRHNGDKLFKWGSIQSNDNGISLSWNKSIIQEGRYYLPCQVSALLSEETAEEITMRASTAEDTKSIFKALDEKVDIKAAIDAALGAKTVKDPEKGKIELKERWTSIKDVEKVHLATKDVWDRHIFVKGVVSWINSEKRSGIGSYFMGLMNPDDPAESIRVRIPETIAADFGELSEVYVFGKTNYSQFKNQETGKWEDGDVILDALGIFVVIRTPPESGSTVDDSNAEISDGWLK